MALMNQQSTLGLGPLPKKTRKEVFLEEMNQVVPWDALVALDGRPPFGVETMLRIHCLQLWWNLSDPAMEEELHDRSLYRRFVGLQGAARMPDEMTILHFRLLLELHELAPQVLATINATLAQQGLMLKTGTVVDATIIAAPGQGRVPVSPRQTAIWLRQSPLSRAGQEHRATGDAVRVGQFVDGVPAVDASAGLSARVGRQMGEPLAHNAGIYW